ncbi:uncharacterized protein TNCV_4702951 [Trichonephila clavipes]|nr:uncharacterized protein TNCV_4702951 [Trichonephila clavipes]
MFHPNLEREHSGGGQGPPTSLPLPPPSREDWRLDCYLKYPHAAKALYIHKYPCLLRDLNPVPTAQQSASLATIPDGRRLNSCVLKLSVLVIVYFFVFENFLACISRETPLSIDRGCGNQMVKVSDRGRPCHEFEPSTTKDPPCRAAMHVKSDES